MEDLIKIISEHLEKYFHQKGMYFLERNTNFFLLLIVFIIIPLTIWLAKKIYKLIVALATNLDPYYTYDEVRKATKYYVKTKFQNLDPANENDLSINQGIVASEKLITFFLKKGLKNKHESKFFFVLADSGMGKTTFLINLYLKYKRSFRINKNSIKILPLGKHNVDIDIKDITSKIDTILLLDAYDEDPKATHNHKNRLAEIVNLTSDFKKVIITSRTQFFSSITDEPYETGLIKFGVDKGLHKFYKVYISAFSEKDIKKYLSQRYSFWQIRRKRNAKKIVLQCPNLMVRPMLLAYIDDLVNHQKFFNYTFQIYEVLIQKWIEREANRFSFQKKDKFKKDLYNFSLSIALFLYNNRKIRGELFINANEIEQFGIENDININELDLKSRSLLNRNSQGQYKFSHKSILEYFVSLKVYSDLSFKLSFDFESMPQSYKFYIEMCEDNMAAHAIHLNKNVPFSDTVFLNFLDKYGSTYDNLYIKRVKSVTILNASEIDEQFFSGSSQIKHVNLLLTDYTEINKILLIPNLQSIFLLNEDIKPSYWHAKELSSNYDYLDKYFGDFKKLIKKIEPNIDKRILNKDPNIGSFRSTTVESMVHPSESNFTELSDLYYLIIMDLKKSIRKINPNLSFGSYMT